MGLTVSVHAETEKDPIRKCQAYADEYYREYQQMCFENVSFAKQQSQWWQSASKTIFDMPIAQQAEYADYVTKKLVKLPHHILLPYIRAALAEPPNSYRELGTCAIGNHAAFILALPDEAERQLHIVKFKILLQ